MMCLRGRISDSSNGVEESKLAAYTAGTILDHCYNSVSLPWGRIDDTAHRNRPTEFNHIYDSDDLGGNMGIRRGNMYGMVVVRVQAHMRDI